MSRRWRTGLPARSVSLDRLSTSPYTGRTMRALLPVAAIAIAVAAFAARDDDTRELQQRPPLLQRAPRRRRRSAARLGAVATHGLSDGARRARPSRRQPHLARRRQTTVKDAAALVEQSKPGLAAQGLTIDRVVPGPHNGVQLDARAARRNQALRQLYVVRNLDAAPTASRPSSSRWRRRSPISPPRAVRSTGSSPTSPSRRPFGPTPSRTRAAERSAGRRRPATNVSGSSPRNRRPNAAMASAPTRVERRPPERHAHVLPHLLPPPDRALVDAAEAPIGRRAVETDVHVIVVHLGVARLLHDERRARHQRRIVARRSSPREATPPPARDG